MENASITEKSKYHVRITPGKKWFELNLREVWRYRDLIILFTKRRFSLIYKQTILGPLWIFLNPFISSLIYAFVFGGIAGINTTGIPHILFYLCSTALWTYFSDCVSKNATTFSSNAQVFGKVYFPRLTIPISNVLSAMIQFGVQMILVLILLVYFIIVGAVHPHWEYWLLIPFILVHIGMMGLGFGIIVSSLTTKYRDLVILVSFGIQLWMYATPIVYPLSFLGGGLSKVLLMINPVTMPIELFRYAVLGQGVIDIRFSLLSFLTTTVVTLFGVMVFNRVEKTFMDTI